MWIWQDVLCASVMRNNILEDKGIYFVNTIESNFKVNISSFVSVA